MRFRHQLNRTTDLVVVSTDRTHGDFAVGSVAVDQRRAALIRPGPWTWLRLEHGAAVVDVEGPGDRAGAVADAAVSRVMDAPIAVTTADCSAVVVGIGFEHGASGAVEATFGVAHAGWRGLLAGVVEAMTARAEALLGPGWEPRTRCSFASPGIGPLHYAFEPSDAQPLVDRYGPRMVGMTATGAPALDMFAGVAAALEGVAYPIPARPSDTADPAYFSHRTRTDPQRMATVAYLAARLDK